MNTNHLKSVDKSFSLEVPLRTFVSWSLSGKKKVLIIISFLFLSSLFCTDTSAILPQSEEETVNRKYFYQGLTGYQLSLFEGFVSSEFPAGKKVSQLLTGDAGLRGATRLAQALLFRNKAGDKENAIEILKWILKNQYTNEKSENYGMWRTNVSFDRLDKNWREFIGCDLILVYEGYKDILPTQLVADIKKGLIRAAKGARKRDVGADYTNISIMSAFLMDYAGSAFQIDELKKAGLKKARDIYQLFQRHQTFSEYNSPTYYGVSLIAIALWRELGSEKLKKMGIALESSMWHEIASNYNPMLKNFVGPYFRAYGMDVKKYHAITSIWIALALDLEKLAPLPVGGSEKIGEMSNITTILHLGLSIPKPVLLQLKEFGSARFLDRLIPSKMAGDSLKHVTAVVNEEWMMGGLWGNRRAWNQIKTGTLHWKNAEGEVEWLLVPGEGTTNVRVTKTAMQIFRADDKSTAFSLYVYAKELLVNNFTEKMWRFPAMELSIESSLKRSYLKMTDRNTVYEECAISEEYPAVMKITFQIPLSWKNEDPLLEIIPVK